VDEPRRLPQGSARRRAAPIALRWQRSQKLLGYYDAESHSLIYQDVRGIEIDRVLLPLARSAELTEVLE